MKTFALRSRDHLDCPDLKRRYNEQLFTEVAPRYDLVTRVLSLGRDRAWKRDLVAALPETRPARCLDLACGTGDLARRVAARYPGASVVGLDLTPAMVARARALPHPPNLSFQPGDMTRLPFDDASVDLVTGGYALRNAPDLETALAEIRRILPPGGHLAFLDFSKPPGRAGQAAGYLLLKGWGSLWGLLLHRHADVYGYIAESLARFPDRRDLRALLRRHRFAPVRSRRYFGGLLEWILLRAET